MFIIDINHQPNGTGITRTTYKGDDITVRLHPCGSLTVSTNVPTLPDGRRWSHTYPPNSWTFVNEYDDDRASDDPYPGAIITQEA